MAKHDKTRAKNNICTISYAGEKENCNMTSISNQPKNTNGDPCDSIDVDGILSHVGNFGRFQIILIGLFSLINALSAFHYFGQTFISVEPNHTCIAQPEETLNNSLLSQISSYDADSCTITYKSVNNTNVIVENCQKWEYNSSYGFISIVQELDWVCDANWKPALGQSVFFVGSLVGSLAFGVLADRIGRLHVLVAANLCAFLGNFITIFAHDAITYGAARFVAGCATDTNFVMMYMIVMEYMKPTMRTAGLNLSIGVFYCVASILVPWLAVILHHWQYFLLAISIPHLLVILFYFSVPESAQWLISKGRFDEAMHCFTRIAKTNGRHLEPKIGNKLRTYMKEHIKEDNTDASFLGLMRTPKLRKKTIILIFKSMVLSLCYDAIARNINGFGYSPFLIFSATSATIFPGCVIILLLQDRIGRKALASGSLFIGGVFISIVGMILTWESASPMLMLVLTVMARLNVIVAFNSGHQYAFELIPTVVRAQGVSVIHVAGFAATFFSPQILYLGSWWRPLPDIIIGLLLIAGAGACLFLPETLDRTLPVTLEDGEMFGEDEGVFEFSCCGRGRSGKGLSESRDVLT